MTISAKIRQCADALKVSPRDFAREALDAACDTVLKHVVGKRCPVCDEKFVPHRLDQRSCSHPCAARIAAGRLRSWTHGEVRLIRVHYPKTGTQILRDLLPSRSLSQIRKKARHLGVRCSFRDMNPADIEARIAEIRKTKASERSELAADAFLSVAREE